MERDLMVVFYRKSRTGTVLVPTYRSTCGQSARPIHNEGLITGVKKKIEKLSIARRRDDTVSTLFDHHWRGIELFQSRYQHILSQN